MTSQEMVAFKNMLKNTAVAIIEERILMTKSAIDSAQEAANNEDKSSAGDKYETGRAMGHLAKDMYARQQAENIKDLDQLQKVNIQTVYSTAQTGAFIRCKDHAFFIAAGLGKQQVAEWSVFFLSPNAPLAKVLFHKKPGDTFLFNKQELLIVEIY